MRKKRIASWKIEAFQNEIRQLRKWDLAQSRLDTQARHKQITWSEWNKRLLKYYWVADPKRSPLGDGVAEACLQPAELRSLQAIARRRLKVTGVTGSSAACMWREPDLMAHRLSLAEHRRFRRRLHRLLNAGKTAEGKRRARAEMVMRKPEASEYDREYKEAQHMRQFERMADSLAHQYTSRTHEFFSFIVDTCAQSTGCKLDDCVAALVTATIALSKSFKMGRGVVSKSVRPKVGLEYIGRVLRRTKEISSQRRFEKAHNWLFDNYQRLVPEYFGTEDVEIIRDRLWNEAANGEKGKVSGEYAS